MYRRQPGPAGIRIEARGANNSDFRVLEAKLIREIPRADRLEVLKPADQDRIMGTLLLETVVSDVEGLAEEHDKTPVSYSREVGEKLLLDPDYRVFRAGAAYAGAIVADHRAADQGIEVKNCGRPDLAAGLGREDRRLRLCCLAAGFFWRRSRALQTGSS